MVDECVRPSGQGPEVLENFWPELPVLILGIKGSGRATWADYLIKVHEALPEFVLRSEDILDWDFDSIVKHLIELNKRPTNVIKWINLDLDDIEVASQNKLLSLIDNLSEDIRIILRSNPQSVSQLLAARCFKTFLVPPSLNETIELLCSQRIRRKDAEELAELRPGQPGLALEFLEHLPYRAHFNSILSASQSRDYTALASALMTCPESTRIWFIEWINQVNSGRVSSHVKLARELSPRILDTALGYLKAIPNPRLAVRVAATLIITR